MKALASSEATANMSEEVHSAILQSYNPLIITEKSGNLLSSYSLASAPMHASSAIDQPIRVSRIWRRKSASTEVLPSDDQAKINKPSKNANSEEIQRELEFAIEHLPFDVQHSLRGVTVKLVSVPKITFEVVAQILEVSSASAQFQLRQMEEAFGGFENIRGFSVARINAPDKRIMIIATTDPEGNCSPTRALHNTVAKFIAEEEISKDTSFRQIFGGIVNDIQFQNEFLKEKEDKETVQIALKHFGYVNARTDKSDGATLIDIYAALFAATLADKEDVYRKVLYSVFPRAINAIKSFRFGV